jgi:hypothetical protein
VNIWTELLSANSVLFESKSGELKAASLNQLVERLTNGTITNLQLNDSNLITFSKKRSSSISSGTPAGEHYTTSSSGSQSPTSGGTSNNNGNNPTIFKRLIGSRERSSSFNASPKERPASPLADQHKIQATDRRRGGIQHTQNVDIVMSPHGSGGQISIRETGEKFELVFLLTFPSFTTSEMFLLKLLQRFECPGHIEKSLARRIQVQVCKVLLRWLQTFPRDFNGKMLQMLKDFMGSTKLSGAFEFTSLAQIVGSFVLKGSLRVSIYT